MGRLIGIDFGLKRVGIAVTDPLKIIATALQTVDNENVFGFLDTYTQQEEVEAFVVGMPVDLNGKPTDATLAVSSFVEQLKKAYPSKGVHLVDERFTSKLALNAMIEAGSKKKDRQNKKNIDKISAVIILQSFLSQ